MAQADLVALNTADIPPAGAGNDGRIILERAAVTLGAPGGERNIYIYIDGERIKLTVLPST